MELFLSLQSVEHVHPQLNDPFSKTFLQIFRCAKDQLENQQRDRLIVKQPRTDCFLESNKKNIVDDEKTEPSGVDDGEKIERLKIVVRRSFQKPLFHNGGANSVPNGCYPQPLFASVNKKQPKESTTTQNPNPNETSKKRKPVETRVLLPKKKPKTKMVCANFIKKQNFVAPNPPPPLPANMAERIRALKGERVELLLYKQLSKTDLSRDHNRLFMPVTQLIDKDFLNDQERAYLDKKVMGKPSEISVRVIQPNCEETQVTFKKWDLKKENGKTSPMFVFIREWNELHHSNHLTVGTVLQIWTFRAPPENQLCFALVRL